MRLEDVPERIESDEEHEHFLAIIEPMMNRDLTPEEDALFRRLVDAVQEYEHRRYPWPGDLEGGQT
jgi:hypothetical protein